VFALGGVASLLLCFMRLFTVIFFRNNHPQRKWNDPHFRFNRSRVNTGPIVLFFLLSVGLFGGVTMAMMHSLVRLCNLFTPPVFCSAYPLPQYLVIYLMAVTAVHGCIFLGFISLNCIFYRCCVRSHTGKFCC